MGVHGLQHALGLILFLLYYFSCGCWCLNYRKGNSSFHLRVANLLTGSKTNIGQAVER